MTVRRSQRRSCGSATTVGLTVAVAAALTACTGAGGESSDDAGAPTAAAAPSTAVVVSPSGAPTTGPVPDPTPASQPVGVATSPTTGSTSPPVTGPPATTGPGIGIPGLDSDDAFCAAWSRFGGSWQVLQVAANFGPDPTLVPLLEVVASPVVTAADDAMFAAWPDELAAERSVAADRFFGPFSRRSETALDSLVTAGAGPADLDAVGTAWLAGLAARSPDSPVVDVVLPDDLWELVRVAANDFDARLVGFLDDPSMVITAATPATDTYLATSCPDRGTLSGGEISGG